MNLRRVSWSVVLLLSALWAGAPDRLVAQDPVPVAEFDFDAYRERHGARALPLLRVTGEGRVVVFTARDTPAAEPGDTLLSLVEPEADELAPRTVEAEPAHS